MTFDINRRRINFDPECKLARIESFCRCHAPRYRKSVVFGVPQPLRIPQAIRERQAFPLHALQVLYCSAFRMP